MDFAELQEEFERLRGLFDAGLITEDELKARVEELRVQDEDGGWWTIGRETGQWYIYEDDEWVQQDPPLAPTKRAGLIGRLPPIPQPAYLAAGGLGAVLVIAVLLAILSPREPDVAVIPPTDTFTPTSTTTVTRTPTRTPTQTAEAAAEVAPCAFPIDRQFADAWNRDRMGCPVELAQETGAAWEAFERGYMIWREDLRRIYVLYADGSWQSFEDTWDSSQAEYSCPGTAPSTTPPTPHRGFGKVWCEHPGTRDRIGLALADERGYRAATQAFQRGMLITTIDDAIYRLLEDGGRWESF